MQGYETSFSNYDVAVCKELNVLHSSEASRNDGNFFKARSLLEDCLESIQYV